MQLWLGVIAYNLGNLRRRLMLPKGIKSWSLISLQQRLVKACGRLVKHVRYYWLIRGRGTSDGNAVRGDVAKVRAVANSNKLTSDLKACKSSG